jgi:long-subunit fatty acid transport protein
MSIHRCAVPLAYLLLAAQLLAAEGAQQAQPQATNPVTTAFAKIDADGDGKLAATELPALMEEIFKAKQFTPPAFMKTKVLKRMTSEADVNQDGSYELSEIEKFTANLP